MFCLHFIQVKVNMTEINQCSTETISEDHSYCRYNQDKYDLNTPSQYIAKSRNEWQEVSRPKRKIPLNQDLLDNSQKKCRPSSRPEHLKTATTDLPLSNSFKVLSDPVEMADESLDNTTTEPKPPPIFIPDIKDVRKMIETIEHAVPKDQYVYKCLPQSKVKINTITSDYYRKLVKLLKDHDVAFYTFQFKHERSFRVVLKNMHFSTDTEDIKNSLEEYGFKVRNVSNAKSFKTKMPLNMFFIDLSPSSNCKDIYNVEYLLNAKIVFEPPYKSNDIVQCKKCQRYGHTRSYCSYPFRCVKCNESHDSTTCRKHINTPPNCVLCGGEHPANYKGCTVYKTIKKKAFPPLRNGRLNEQSTAGKEKETQPPNNSQTDGQPNRSLSYSQATKNEGNPSTNTNVEVNNLNLTLTMTTFFDKFEKLMSQQAKQIDTLVNLLTTVISKLK